MLGFHSISEFPLSTIATEIVPPQPPQPIQPPQLGQFVGGGSTCDDRNKVRPIDKDNQTEEQLWLERKLKEDEEWIMILKEFFKNKN
jgi:hypothetical protein